MRGAPLVVSASGKARANRSAAPPGQPTAHTISAFADQALSPTCQCPRHFARCRRRSYSAIGNDGVNDVAAPEEEESLFTSSSSPSPGMDSSQEARTSSASVTSPPGGCGCQVGRAAVEASTQVTS